MKSKNISSVATLTATSVVVEGTDPLSYISDTNAATDTKIYRWYNNGGTLTLSTRDDADSAGSAAITITRSTTTVSTLDLNGTAVGLQSGGTDRILVDGTGIGFFNTTPAAQPSAYTRNATVVEDRTLLASASATATNNNNVLAALIGDLQTLGLIG